MAQYYPVVVQSGNNLAGDSLGFHAYSLRLDNCTNQWYLEETSMAYIPPYSLGLCLRLYGTGVAILLNSAPVGQPQLAPVAGEQVIGVYSDQLRTEVAASPIRQFTLVQAVSDLTEGPQPALPPVGVDRIYADTSGNIHHLHSNGVDLTLVDPSNAGTLLYPTFDPHYQALINSSITSQVPGMIGGTALGGDLSGTVSNGHVLLANASPIEGRDTSGTAHVMLSLWNDNTTVEWDGGGAGFRWMNQSGSVQYGSLVTPGDMHLAGNIYAGPMSGVLTGSLPSPGMAAGAAAANVGPLGGILTGNLPSPSLSRLLSYPDLASGAASVDSGYVTSQSAAVSTTTPAALFGGTITFSLTTVGGPVAVWLSLSVTFNLQYMVGYLDVQVDGNWYTISAHTSTVSADQTTLYGMAIFGVTGLGPLAAGTHTFTMGAHVNTSSMTIIGTPYIWFFANEFRR